MPGDFVNEDEEDWNNDFDEPSYHPDDPETYPEGVYADPELPLIDCPHCGQEVVEDSVRCPNCEMYLSQEDAPAKSRGGFVVVVSIISLLIVILWIIGRG